MGIRLDLEVTDPEVVAELERRSEGEERNRYALSALRIGVLSLRAAGGQVDAAAIKEAGQVLVADVKDMLTKRATELSEGMASEFRKYFDKESGVLSQRVDSIVGERGELALVLQRYVGDDDSVVARTLAKQLGDNSPIFRLLSPTDSKGLKAQVEDTLRTELAEQRKSIVADFNLNNPESALSRLKTNLEQTLRDYEKRNLEFREKVLEKLTEIKTRREEELRSTLHGALFEDQLGSLLAAEAQRLGDIHEATGNSTGKIKNCKVGDHVIALGPESAAPGARIAFEAKEDRSYSLAKALDEIETARKNREAQLGVFVFSARTAPEDLEPLVRYGSDIVVVWDAEDANSEIRLRSAFSIARALCVKLGEQAHDVSAAVGEIESATRDVEKQIKYLDEFEKWAGTIESNAKKIAERSDKMRAALARQVKLLDEQLLTLKTES